MATWGSDVDTNVERNPTDATHSFWIYLSVELLFFTSVDFNAHTKNKKVNFKNNIFTEKSIDRLLHFQICHKKMLLPKISLDFAFLETYWDIGNSIPGATTQCPLEVLHLKAF